jgi:hypothetical protein
MSTCVTSLAQWRPRPGDKLQSVGGRAQPSLERRKKRDMQKEWIKRMLLSVLAVAILCSGLLIACSYSEEPVAGSVVDGLPIDIYRYIDREAGVVCYKYDSAKYQQGGLSCLPLDQTRLGK